MPEGARVIEYGAYRGQRQVKGVVLPDTLEEIGDLAFSCTSLRSVRLPANCVRLGERSLRTGPETIPGADRTYRSTIERIEVDPENPLYCVSGSVLCRRLDDGTLEAVLCPGSTDEAIFGPEVSRVASVAFDGTHRIGTLRFHEGLFLEDGAGIAVHASCERVIIDRAQPVAGRASIELRMPPKEFQARILATTLGVETVDVKSFCEAYDMVLPEIPDRLLRAQLMLGRLAAPMYLEADSRCVFEEFVVCNLQVISVHFGARAYWRGFDDMVEANLLGSEGIARLCGFLSERGDAAASAYLLKLKRERFGREAWDYGL